MCELIISVKFLITDNEIHRLIPLTLCNNKRTPPEFAMLLLLCISPLTPWAGIWLIFASVRACAEVQRLRVADAHFTEECSRFGTLAVEGMCLKSICTSTFEDRRDHLRVMGKHIWQVRATRSFVHSGKYDNRLRSWVLFCVSIILLFSIAIGLKIMNVLCLCGEASVTTLILLFVFLLFFYFLKTLKRK